MISVLIPCYNYAHYVGQAIESVLAQTNGDLELIVIDNGSTDDSWKVIQSYKDARIKTFRIEKNEGIVKAWAFGLEQCTGEWFSFLSADDYLMPQKHEVLLQYLAAHPEVDVVGGYVTQVDENGCPWKRHAWMEKIINEPRDFNRGDSWLMRHYLCIPAALYRRSQCTPPTGGINAVSDYDFHVRLLRRGCRFAQLRDVVACYRWHTSNTSGSATEQSTAPLQFAYCFATQFLPYLRDSGQEDLATAAITFLFDHYYLQIQASTPQQVKSMMLCMLWPDWVVANCADYHAVLTLDWASGQAEPPLHALKAIVDGGCLKSIFPKKEHEHLTEFPQKKGPPKKRGPLREAGRKFERTIRKLVRGNK
ncbi:MAG: glycosyltransferase [Prosthecobacter sp.]|uniref:glycosyltransferase n=1 Tax=Prosthecobacter sp. TaxID=1965333 RepID=UPI003BAEC809